MELALTFGLGELHLRAPMPILLVRARGWNAATSPGGAPAFQSDQ